MTCGYRKTHGHLTVVRLAQLSAILVSNPNRVRTFLGKTGIVYDPCFHRSFLDHRRKHFLSHSPEQNLIFPRCIGNQVMHGLMHLPHIVWSKSRRHRFDALALIGNSNPLQYAFSGS